MMSELKPRTVWKYFDEITRIPRPSKQEDRIRDYLMTFGRSHGLETFTDEVGNVLIKKAATPGKETVRPVVLQSHMDMVCEKNSDVEFNFETDPIKTYIDGDWVKAEGTTLGADNGIGMAYQLAILASEDIPHGPIECLITTDEETGMTGAKGMKPGFFTANTLINLDSEEDDEMCIGCAGGLDSVVRIPFQKEPVPGESTCFRLSVTGLKGGHSSEIDRSPGNSNKILARVLLRLFKEFEIGLSGFHGGNLRNAIPREAVADIFVKDPDKEQLLGKFTSLCTEIQKEYAGGEPGLVISARKNEVAPDFVIDGHTASNLLKALHAAPNGVIGYSFEMDGLIETSTNLAAVKLTENNEISINFLSRSAIDSAKYSVADAIESVFSLIGAKTEHSGAYPGWAPDKNSDILNTAVLTYRDLFNEDPKVMATHGGLECGLIMEKYPDLDAISIGPTMRDVHSPNERMNIRSVEKTWKLLLSLVDNV